MAVKTSWSAGDVLAAADLTDTFAAKSDYAMPKNAQTGTTYTFVLADAGKLVTASNAASSTYTVPPQSSVAWTADTILRVTNLGAGVVTFAGGSGVTVTNTAATLAQYASANLIRTGSDAWTVVPFSGGGAKPAVYSSSTGSPTITSDSSYTYYKFTGSGSITFSAAGQIDCLVVGSGGGGDYNSTQYNGGGAGAVRWGIFAVTASAYTVTVGLGGAASNAGNKSEIVGLLSSGGGQRGVAAGTGTVIFTVPGGGGSAGGLSVASTSGTSPGGGAGGTVYGSNNYDGIAISYSGASVTYGVGGYTGTTGTANTGNGGYNTGAGGSGIVIIRIAK